MSARTALAIVVLSLSVGGFGCQSSLTDAARSSLPGFGAPEQWEPEVEAAPERSSLASDERDD